MASKAVNKPTNVKLKEQDVNQKLQLYGIYSAFANGKVPSNKQIDVAMNSAISHSALTSPSTKLSTEGQHLIRDLRSVIEQAKVLFLTKNEGNVLQDFIWHSEQLNGGNAALPGAPVDKATAQQHGNEALDGLRTLGTLLISNGQFRKLLNDFTILIRDIAGDAAQNAATRVNPSKDQLSQIDKPADDNTWHEVPDLSKEGLKNQAKATYDKNSPLKKKDLQDAAGDASQTADPSGSRDPTKPAQGVAEAQADGTTTAVDGQAGARAGLETLQQRASTNIPEDTKQKGREFNQRTKNYIGEKMPQERREQTIWRLKKMVVEIQGHSDYQRAIETLLNLAETYAGHSKNVSQQATGTVKGAHDDNHLTTAEADLRTLIERFANSTSMDDLFDSLNQVYRDAERDPELKGWFKNIDAYIRKCLKQQGYIMEDTATQEWNQLYDQGNFLLRERYRDHTNRIMDETKFLADQFDQDPQNKAFAQSMEKLFNDLGNDENGKPVFKPHLLKDLSNVILPAIFENVSYVPIPRIEYSDPMIDAVVENLIIESDNLMPNVFELGSDNYFRWGRKQIGSKNTNKIMISISGVQMDLKDVSYYIKKKTGFPSITDKGVADIFMGGQGFSFKIQLSTAEKSDRAHFFKVDKVDVDVKNLNVKLKQSKYKLIFGLFKPLMFKVIRPAIQKVLEKQIRDTVHKLDGLAWEVHEEAKKAEAEAKAHPDQAANIYNRYYTAAQKKILQGKKTAEEKKNAAAANTKVNVAVTQHDSIFKDIKLPGGISTKATEFKDLAAKGEKWESPVFSIGSTAESTNIPKVAPVQRKSHSTAQGGVRGPNQPGSSTAGFSNQVNQAFGDNKDLSLNRGAASNAPTNGTYLGSNNPVLNGTTNKTTGGDVRAAMST